jgi:hypothetical protein
MAWGGARSGAGRPVGTGNKAHALLVAAMRRRHRAEPLDFFLALMKRQGEDPKIRLDAAKAAAQYMMPRLESVQYSMEETENDLVDLGLLTDEELLQWKALQIKARYQPPTNGHRNGANEYPTTDFFGSARSRTVSSKGRLCKKSGESIRKRSLDRRRT